MWTLLSRAHILRKLWRDGRLTWRLFRDAQITIPAAQREIILRREDPPGAGAPP